jgi:hypothetical protein
VSGQRLKSLGCSGAETTRCRHADAVQHQRYVPVAGLVELEGWFAFFPSSRNGCIRHWLPWHSDPVLPGLSFTNDPSASQKISIVRAQDVGAAARLAKTDSALHPRFTAPPRSPQFVGLDRHLDNPIVKFFGALEIKIRFAFVHTIKLALQPDSLPRKAKTLISGGLVEPLLDFRLGERPFVALPASNDVLFELVIKANS